MRVTPSGYDPDTERFLDRLRHLPTTMMRTRILASALAITLMLGIVATALLAAGTPD